MIKIYVACAPKGLDAEAQMVLDYSIRKFTTVDYEIIWLQDSEDEDSPLFNWNMDTWETPFCGFKWAIPELSNYEGESIYLSYNQIIMEDIAKIVEADFEEDKVLLTAKDSALNVIKFNNSKIKKYLPTIEEMKISSSAHQFSQGYFFNNEDKIQFIEGDWGTEISDIVSKSSVLYYNLRETYLDKYTFPRLKKLGEEHWFSSSEDREETFTSKVFEQYYEEALNEGYTVENYVRGI
jgi:hypothetical protein